MEINVFALKLTTLDILIRVGLSILIGGIIGYERGIHNRPAGFRTHILVCLGATIVSLVQDKLRVSTIEFMIMHPEFKGFFSTDVGRIGAQVVSGIGFLGAGTIMKGRGIIEGLTTAASLWATGCIGLGIGWGFYNLSLIAGGAIIIVLVTLKHVERSMIETKYVTKLDIQFIDNSSFINNTIAVYKVLEEMNAKVLEIEKSEEEKTFFCRVNVPKQFNSTDLVTRIFSTGIVDKINCK